MPTRTEEEHSEDADDDNARQVVIHVNEEMFGDAVREVVASKTRAFGATRKKHIQIWRHAKSADGVRRQSDSGRDHLHSKESAEKGLCTRCWRLAVKMAESQR